MPTRLKSASTTSLHTPGIPYQPPLTPVDEGSDSDENAGEVQSIDRATISSTTSGSTSDQSYFHARPLNFSRPRPVDFSPAHKVQHDHTNSSSSSIISSHSSVLPLIQSNNNTLVDSYKEIASSPAHETHFSFNPPTSAALDHADHKKSGDPDALSADFDWEASLKDMKPAQRALEYDAQRNQMGSKSQPSTTQLQPVELVGSQPPSLPSSSNGDSSRHTRTGSFDDEEWEGEDVRSHHTASEDDDEEAAAVAIKTAWKSSSYDVSSLTQSELKKLRKKGINPALYAEMKAARKGKGSRWINPLVGNTYLS